MADVTLTIPKPALYGLQKFKTRYRLLPNGAYSSNVDRTNAPFTLSGLDMGQYEMEVIFVLADGTECTAIFYPFEVITPFIPDDVSPPEESPAEPYFQCAEFEAQILQSGLNFYLNITYPTPVVQAPCGWRIFYAERDGGSAFIPYATLPDTGVINIPLSGNNPTDLSILANPCQGLEAFCFEDTVPALPSEDVSCSPAVLLDAQLIYNDVSSPQPNTWFLELTITNSTPQSPFYAILIQEGSIVAPGAIPDTRNVIVQPQGVAGGTATYRTQLFPQGIFLVNPLFPTEYVTNCISYIGTIVDVCNNSETYSVSGRWEPTPHIKGQGTFTEDGC